MGHPSQSAPADASNLLSSLLQGYVIYEGFPECEYHDGVQPPLAARASASSVFAPTATYSSSSIGSASFSSSSRLGFAEGPGALASTAAAFFGGERLMAAARLGDRFMATQPQPWLLRWRNVSGSPASGRLLYHRPRTSLLSGSAVFRTRFGCAAAAARGAMLVF